VSNRRHLGGKTWPATVERSRFEALAALLDRRGAAGRVPRRRSLLTGIVRCAVCGRTMVRTGGGSGRHVWRCPSGHASIDAKGLETLLVEATFERADTARLAEVALRMDRDEGFERVLAELDEIERRVG